MSCRIAVTIALGAAFLIPGCAWPQDRGEPGENAVERLSRVKVVSVYESVLDGHRRSVGAIADLFAETKTGYVHRGFYRHTSALELKSETERRAVDVYAQLRDAIAAIKKKNPDLLFGAAIPAQQISAVEHDPVTDEIIPREKTWAMTLDPRAHGFEVTREEVHRKYTEQAGIDMYFPDITNPDFQKLFLDICRKLVDCGADAIWIDGLHWQASACARLAKDLKHDSVRRALEAAGILVEGIRKYGASKGRRILVGSWGAVGAQEPPLEFPFPPPKLDFLSLDIPREEIRAGKPDEGRWTRYLAQARRVYGNVPMFPVIDWGFHTDMALGIFSQDLSKDQACAALRAFDRFFAGNGVLFAYPLHGGFMGWEAKRLTSGKGKTYDSLAPEFDTYGTIRELARERTEGTKP